MSLALFRNWRTQFYPPKPSFTEKHVGPQNGRVFIVTGGNAGVGFELVKILYTTGATIYMASRSKVSDHATPSSDAEAWRCREILHPRWKLAVSAPPMRPTSPVIAIETITSATSALENPGIVKFLHLDLNDLDIVKLAAATFARQESKLDVLWNNAGMGGLILPPGSRTKQGFEAMIGMHCIAAQLFTHLLLPQLRNAVTNAPKGSVRVVWTSSFLADSHSPTNGIEFNLLEEGTMDRPRNYAQSKAGNWFLGHEMASRHGSEGIVSVTQNPGNLRAGSYVGTPALAMLFFDFFFLHDTKFGGYTELYAGLSPEISLENNGAYVIPWGRIRADEDCPRKDVVNAIKSEADGGLGYAAKFWDWCEEQWKPFV
ncbi:short-chain dehydrogenase [Colletotrichum incanum]|uniref:Short-chain dehydrogenase n=1 Tax=Colletotrichum incanum TaxID=1573173 RepID=A0A166Q262_COLIC|nr:short-chain dehydrogenase [Colletotrichum incanum]